MIVFPTKVNAAANSLPTIGIAALIIFPIVLTTGVNFCATPTNVRAIIGTIVAIVFTTVFITGVIAAITCFAVFIAFGNTALNVLINVCIIGIIAAIAFDIVCLIAGITLIKASFTFITTGFILSQFLIIRNAAAATAASTAITIPAGLVISAITPPAFATAPVTIPTVEYTLPIVDTNLPKISNTGPIAAAIPANFIIILTCASDSPLNQSVAF